jgi:hypothetical protein
VQARANASFECLTIKKKHTTKEPPMQTAIENEIRDLLDFRKAKDDLIIALERFERDVVITASPNFAEEIVYQTETIRKRARIISKATWFGKALISAAATTVAAFAVITRIRVHLRERAESAFPLVSTEEEKNQDYEVEVEKELLIEKPLEYRNSQRNLKVAALELKQRIFAKEQSKEKEARTKADHAAAEAKHQQELEDQKTKAKAINEQNQQELENRKREELISVAALKKAQDDAHSAAQQQAEARRQKEVHDKKLEQHRKEQEVADEKKRAHDLKQEKHQAKVRLQEKREREEQIRIENENIKLKEQENVRLSLEKRSREKEKAQKLEEERQIQIRSDQERAIQANNLKEVERIAQELKIATEKEEEAHQKQVDKEKRERELQAEIERKKQVENHRLAKIEQEKEEECRRQHEREARDKAEAELERQEEVERLAKIQSDLLVQRELESRIAAEKAAAHLQQVEQHEKNRKDHLEQKRKEAAEAEAQRCAEVEKARRETDRKHQLEASEFRARLAREQKELQQAEKEHQQAEERQKKAKKQLQEAKRKRIEELSTKHDLVQKKSSSLHEHESSHERALKDLEQKANDATETDDKLRIQIKNVPEKLDAFLKVLKSRALLLRKTPPEDWISQDPETSVSRNEAALLAGKLEQTAAALQTLNKRSQNLRDQAEESRNNQGKSDHQTGQERRSMHTFLDQFQDLEIFKDMSPAAMDTLFQVTNEKASLLDLVRKKFNEHESQKRSVLTNAEQKRSVAENALAKLNPVLASLEKDLQASQANKDSFDTQTQLRNEIEKTEKDQRTEYTAQKRLQEARMARETPPPLDRETQDRVANEKIHLDALITLEQKNTEESNDTANRKLRDALRDSDFEQDLKTDEDINSAIRDLETGDISKISSLENEWKSAQEKHAQEKTENDQEEKKTEAEKKQAESCETRTQKVQEATVNVQQDIEADTKAQKLAEEEDAEEKLTNQELKQAEAELESAKQTAEATKTANAEKEEWEKVLKDLEVFVDVEAEIAQIVRELPLLVIAVRHKLHVRVGLLLATNAQRSDYVHHIPSQPLGPVMSIAASLAFAEDPVLHRVFTIPKSQQARLIAIADEDEQKSQDSEQQVYPLGDPTNFNGVHPSLWMVGSNLTVRLQTGNSSSGENWHVITLTKKIQKETAAGVFSEWRGVCTWSQVFSNPGFETMANPLIHNGEEPPSNMFHVIRNCTQHMTGQAVKILLTGSNQDRVQYERLNIAEYRELTAILQITPTITEQRTNFIRIADIHHDSDNSENIVLDFEQRMLFGFLFDVNSNLARVIPDSAMELAADSIPVEYKRSDEHSWNKSVVDTKQHCMFPLRAHAKESLTVENMAEVKEIPPSVRGLPDGTLNYREPDPASLDVFDAIGEAHGTSLNRPSQMFQFASKTAKEDSPLAEEIIIIAALKLMASYVGQLSKRVQWTFVRAKEEEEEEEEENPDAPITVRVSVMESILTSQDHVFFRDSVRTALDNRAKMNIALRIFNAGLIQGQDGQQKITIDAVALRDTTIKILGKEAVAHDIAIFNANGEYYRPFCLSLTEWEKMKSLFIHDKKGFETDLRGNDYDFMIAQIRSEKFIKSFYRHPRASKNGAVNYFVENHRKDAVEIISLRLLSLFPDMRTLNNANEDTADKARARFFAKEVQILEQPRVRQDQPMMLQRMEPLYGAAPWSLDVLNAVRENDQRQNIVESISRTLVENNLTGWKNERSENKETFTLVMNLLGCQVNTIALSREDRTILEEHTTEIQMSDEQKTKAVANLAAISDCSSLDGDPTFQDLEAEP